MIIERMNELLEELAYEKWIEETSVHPIVKRASQFANKTGRVQARMHYQTRGLVPKGTEYTAGLHDRAAKLAQQHGHAKLAAHHTKQAAKHREPDDYVPPKPEPHDDSDNQPTGKHAVNTV